MYVKDFPPVYLHLIFEISSVTRFFFNFEISSLKNQKINLISKLIFAGYTGSKNQVRTRKKIKFDSKSIFFQVCNKLPNWHFKNQAQIDTVIWPIKWTRLVYFLRLSKVLPQSMQWKEPWFFWWAWTWRW